MGRRLDREAILACLPQQPPFCFLDEAEVDEQCARGSYTITGHEDFLRGHFKDNPVFPASIVFEALGQAGCLWIVQMAPAIAGLTVRSSEMYFTSMESARFFRKVVPGDRLELTMTLVRLRPPLAIFKGSVACAGQNVASVERLVFAFAFDPLETEKTS